MDGLELLREVSEAYRKLKSLAIEAAIVSESGDENSNQRGEHRVRFFYEAPDRIRFEPCGKNGIVQVADGDRLHTLFRTPQSQGGPRYGSIPVAEMRRLPHLFRPECPFSGGDEAFLFQGIDERVTATEVLREEDGCHVVSVTHEPSPYPSPIIGGSAVLFWVNAENLMVVRQQGDVGHRFPTEDEVTWSQHTMLVREMRHDEPLPEETFHFTPPADASLEARRGCGLSIGGGSGFIECGPNDQRRLEHRSSHEWDGDTLVERSKWKMHGMVLNFERRLTFSGDEKDLHVAERISGPQGEVENSCNLRVG
jgi:outer membrane lipoprotein-sorting protein